MPENRILRVLWNRLRRIDDAGLTSLTVLRARELLRFDPEFGPAWITLGHALVSLARYEEAEAALNRAIGLSSSKYRHLPLHQMGHLFDERGDYEQAARWYRQAIEVNPRNASGYIYLGGVLAKQGRLREAEQVHRTGTECPEGCIDEAYLNLGLVLRAQERFEEAANCFRKAIELDPRYRDARRALRDTERCLRMLDGIG